MSENPTADPNRVALTEDDTRFLLEVLRWHGEYIAKRLDTLERRQLTKPHSSRQEQVAAYVRDLERVDGLVDRLGGDAG